MKMRTHLSSKADKIVLREVDVTRHTYFKPRGFWYEVDGDWQRWTQAEDFGSYQYIFEVEVADCNISDLYPH